MNAFSSATDTSHELSSSTRCASSTVQSRMCCSVPPSSIQRNALSGSSIGAFTQDNMPAICRLFAARSGVFTQEPANWRCISRRQYAAYVALGVRCAAPRTRSTHFGIAVSPGVMSKMSKMQSQGCMTFHKVPSLPLSSCPGARDCKIWIIE